MRCHRSVSYNYACDMNASAYLSGGCTVFHIGEKPLIIEFCQNEIVKSETNSAFL